MKQAIVQLKRHLESSKRHLLQARKQWERGGEYVPSKERQRKIERMIKDHIRQYADAIRVLETETKRREAHKDESDY